MSDARLARRERDEARRTATGPPTTAVGEGVEGAERGPNVDSPILPTTPDCLDSIPRPRPVEHWIHGEVPVRAVSSKKCKGRAARGRGLGGCTCSSHSEGGLTSAIGPALP